MLEHATPRYIQYTNQLDKRPVYFVKFGPIQSTELLRGSGVTEGISINYLPQFSTNPNLALPMQFASAEILNATQKRLNILNVPSSVTQQINPVAGSTTVGQVQFSLTDKNNVITDMLHSYIMKNRTVTIYGGYQELNEFEYRSLFTGIIVDVQLQNNAADYVFYLQDLNRYLHTGATGSLFDGATSLVSTCKGPSSSTATDWDTKASVYGTNGFAPRTDMGRVLPPYITNINGASVTVSGVPLPVYNFIRIDDEIMAYTSITPPTTNPNGSQNPGTFNGLQRGQLLNGPFPEYNTSTAPIATHDAGAQVSNFIQIGPINPIDLALMLMSSNHGDGTNGPYDLLGWGPKLNAIPSGLNDQNQGCTTPVQYIDVSGILSLRDQYFADDRMTFYIEKPIKAADFIANELYTFENCFPVVKMNGQLSLARYGNGALPPGGITYTFNDTNTVPNTLQWAANLQTNQGIYNYIEVDYDYDNILDESLAIAYNYQANSINNTGEMAQLKLPSTGLRSGLTNNFISGNKLIQRFANNLFARYAFGAQKITFNSFYTGHLVDPGDWVMVEMSPLPNMQTGTRGGIPYPCQIVQKNINFQTGQIQYVALTAGMAATNIASNAYTNGTTTNASAKGSFITPQSILNGGVFPTFLNATAAQIQQGYTWICESGFPFTTVPLMSNGAIGNVIQP